MTPVELVADQLQIPAHRVQAALDGHGLILFDGDDRLTTVCRRLRDKGLL